MKKICSNSLLNEQQKSFDEIERLELHRLKIARFLATQEDLFKKYNITDPSGEIEQVELYVLEPSELEDYYTWISERTDWEKFKEDLASRTISFNIEKVY